MTGFSYPPCLDCKAGIHCQVCSCCSLYGGTGSTTAAEARERLLTEPRRTSTSGWALVWMVVWMAVLIATLLVPSWQPAIFPSAICLTVWTAAVSIHSRLDRMEKR